MPFIFQLIEMCLTLVYFFMILLMNLLSGTMFVSLIVKLLFKKNVKYPYDEHYSKEIPPECLSDCNRSVFSLAARCEETGNPCQLDCVRAKANICAIRYHLHYSIRQLV